MLLRHALRFGGAPGVPLDQRVEVLLLLFRKLFGNARLWRLVRPERLGVVLGGRIGYILFYDIAAAGLGAVPRTASS